MSGSSSQLVIIAGPNGAGQSTLAPLLLRDWLGLMEFVNADTIASGLSAFHPESAAIEAGRIMLRRLHELAAKGESFAFETTLTTRSYARWLSQLSGGGYRVSLMFIWLDSAELAIERVRARVVSGGHDIPEETVRQRYRKGICNFFALYRQLAESWGVYDNSAPGSPVMLAQGERTSVQRVFLPDRWARFCEVAK